MRHLKYFGGIIMAVTQIKIDKKDLEKLNIKPGNGQKGKENNPKTGKIIFNVVCAIIAVAYFALILFGKFMTFVPKEFLDSINPFSGAENPNAWLRFVGMAVVVLTASFILRFLLNNLLKAKNVAKKISIAFIELLANLVKYASFIVLALMFLGACGVNTGEILAGLGILALIIGLGVTSLIEDIVAGIFIIAERLFDVGDIIVVDGFRGTVVSIGIRSTKLADVGGDILTMRNSSIGSLVNLTDRQSCAAITIPLAPDESLERAEQIIRDGHIEKIKDTCDLILSDPLYLGLCEINSKGVQMLLFIAACKEESRYDVERALYHGLKVMFESNGVKLGAPVINSEEQ